MGAGVPFEVKRVVEALATERAEISLDVAVTLEVSTQHSLLRERLTTDAASELVVHRLLACTAQRHNLVSAVADGPRDARRVVNRHAVCIATDRVDIRDAARIDHRMATTKADRRPFLSIYVLTALSDDRPSVAKFSKSSILDKVPQESRPHPYFRVIRISLQHSVG